MKGKIYKYRKDYHIFSATRTIIKSVSLGKSANATSYPALIELYFFSVSTSQSRDANFLGEKFFFRQKLENGRGIFEATGGKG